MPTPAAEEATASPDDQVEASSALPADGAETSQPSPDGRTAHGVDAQNGLASADVDDIPAIDDAPAGIASEPAGSTPATDAAAHGSGALHVEGSDVDGSDDTPIERDPSDPKSDWLDELATVYGRLPLPVLVQLRETLVYGNREFFDLTGYRDIAALNEVGGLARLFAEDQTGAVAPSDGEMVVNRATGDTIALRTHMQRSTIASRSCLVMSFFATPRRQRVGDLSPGGSGARGGKSGRPRDSARYGRIARAGQ